MSNPDGFDFDEKTAYVALEDMLHVYNIDHHALPVDFKPGILSHMKDG